MESPCNTLFVEDAALLARQDCGSQQYLVKFAAPQCARAAQPGQFVHLGGDLNASLSQPLPIMRVNALRGTLEILCTAASPGLSALVNTPIGEKVRLTGPLGQHFKPTVTRPRTVLIGVDAGIASMIFLAEVLCDRHDAPWKPLVLLASDGAFPFRARPSTIIVDGMPNGVIAGLSFLDEQGIASRLSSRAELPGCHDGLITELADAWLATLNKDTLTEVELFGCGPISLLETVPQVAHKFGVAYQVALDKYGD